MHSVNENKALMASRNLNHEVFSEQSNASITVSENVEEGIGIDYD